MKLWFKVVARLRYGWPPALFDSAWYSTHYEDVRISGVDAWWHFMTHGIREGRQPNILFSPSWYLTQNRDVAGRGLNPLLHYVKHGSAENRDPHPFFDVDWYCDRYPDVRASGREPLYHFLTFGLKEGRQPNPHFNAERYLAQHPEAAASGQSLVEHYIRNLTAESRSGIDPSAFAGDPGVGYEPENGRYVLNLSGNDYAYIPERRPADLEAILNGLGKRVKFSIVVPVYDTPEGLLEKLFLSLADQYYENWEVLFIDDGSSKPHVHEVLSALETRDKRVRILKTIENGGIALATNFGLRHASGDYIVFLDHDDELTCDCLFELARRIDSTDADFIYSDEDKIDAAGRYVEPFFKPDWSPDTFMSTMYTCHVSCVRRSLADDLGGLRPEYDGAQDWDFILRVTEKAKRIEHIAKVLYHWRILPNSIAADISAKPDAIARGRKAREDAIARRGLTGWMMDVETVYGHCVPVYACPSEKKILIVIPSKDNVRFLSRCVETVLGRTSSAHYEIIVVDNGSRQADTQEYLRGIESDDRVKVRRRDVDFNFSHLCNFGVVEAKGDVIVFLNDDTEVLQPDWLERLAGHACLSHVGAVGAKLLYGHDRSVQHNGIVNLADGPGHAFLGRGENEAGYFARNALDGNWIAVTAACMAIEREKFDAIGRFDENLSVAYNDVDLCLRLYKAGYYNVNCATVKMIHHESVSRGVDHLSCEKKKRLIAERSILYAKHPEFYMWDPFFNSNFHANDPQFQLSNRWSGAR